MEVIGIEQAYNNRVDMPNSRSMIRWCKENGVSPSSLYYWIKKIRFEAPEILVSNDSVATPYKQDVVPLHIIEEHPVAPSTQNMPAIVLHMGSMTLDVHNGANESTITNTINALRQLC